MCILSRGGGFYHTRMSSYPGKKSRRTVRIAVKYAQNWMEGAGIVPGGVKAASYHKICNGRFKRFERL